MAAFVWLFSALKVDCLPGNASSSSVACPQVSVLQDTNMAVVKVGEPAIFPYLVCVYTRVMKNGLIISHESHQGHAVRKGGWRRNMVVIAHCWQSSQAICVITSHRMWTRPADDRTYLAVLCSKGHNVLVWL